jgi:hypothetical protein
MKFKRVLHPEIVLDKRGSDVERMLYRMAKQITRDEQAFAWRIPNTLTFLDLITQQHLCVASVFQKSAHKIYHFGADLLSDLQQIDKDIPLEFLPDNFVAYISFPEGLVKDEEHHIQGAYVIIGSAMETGFGIDLPEDVRRHEKVFYLSYVTDGGAIGNNLFRLTPGKVWDMVKDLKHMDSPWFTKDAHVSPEVLRIREVVYRTIVNCVLYLHKRDPDMQKLLPEEGFSFRRRKAYIAKGGQVSDCTLPVTVVGYSYAKPKEYTIDATWVKTHPRWQRCGPGFSQIDLVWVKGHERHYKKLDTEHNEG